MATRRGTKKIVSGEPGDAEETPSREPVAFSNSKGRRGDVGEEARGPAESLGAVPELLRRALEMGLSTFFLTEATIRKAVGDTIPKDWVDFAVDQSDRTRAELLERLSLEIGRSIESIDYVSVLERLMEGRTLEINARVKLGSRREGQSATKIHVSLEDDEEAD